MKKSLRRVTPQWKLRERKRSAWWCCAR